MKSIIFRLVLIFALALMLLGLFTGCNTLKVDRKRVSKVAFRHPGVLTEYCASKFVGKDSIHTEIKYLPGKVDTIPGEVIVIDCDSVKKDSTKSHVVRIPCPPSTHTVDTINHTETRTVTDPAAVAKIQLLTDSLNIYKAKLTVKTEDLKVTKCDLRTWKLRAWGIFGIFLILAIIKLYIKWRRPI